MKTGTWIVHLATGVLLTASTVWVSPAGEATWTGGDRRIEARAEVGSKSCDGQGTIAVKAYAHPAAGARVVVRTAGPPSSSTSWERRLKVQNGLVTYATWAFVSPIVSGDWTAGPILDDDVFTASATCSKQDPPTRILRESRSFGSRDCADGKNVMIYGDGSYEVWFSWTRDNLTRRLKLGSSASGGLGGRVSFNKVDTGLNRISSARVEVRSESGQTADDYLLGVSTGCSVDTVGD